jgi:thiamine-phosphate pyrophosphorylase
VHNFFGRRLYAIIDLNYVSDEQAPAVLRKLIDGGIDVVQLRGKGRRLDELNALAGQLLEQTAAARVPFIVNDHAAVANRLELQGVHVGQDDDSIEQVRDAVNRPIIVGKSTHSLSQAIAAEREGADYIGFGPLFATPTKPDYKPIGLNEIREVHLQVKIPIFCIGGIKLENLPQVIAAGAKRVVIVSGLLQSDEPADYARRTKHLLGHVGDPRLENGNP